MPEVALGVLPNGFASASMNCPTLRLSLLPVSTGVRWSLSTFNSAMSLKGSRPTTLAVDLVPSLKPTSTSRICPTTWLLVTMCPSLVQTVPVPPHPSSGSERDDGWGDLLSNVDDGVAYGFEY